MRKLTIGAVVMLGFTLLGCSNDSSPCERDRLFCRDPATWPVQARQSSVADLISLYDIDRSHFRPPSDVFVQELGRRGEATLAALVRYMERHPETRTRSFYGPVVLEVAFSSGFDFCRSPYRLMLARLLPNSWKGWWIGTNEREELTKLCISKTYGDALNLHKEMRLQVGFNQVAQRAN